MRDQDQTVACALCKQQKPLCDSHVIPAFVGKWLKETSATGFLRSATSLNLRQQDLLTKRLLCADCEARLSGFERLAAERLFLPYVDNPGRVRFEYEEWLLKFAISLSWRCLAASDGSGLNSNPEHVAPVEAASGEFGAYLLDQRAAPKPYRHNLFFLTAGAQSGSELPERMTSYFLPAVERRLCTENRRRPHT
jgi:hypothetical protein